RDQQVEHPLRLHGRRGRPLRRRRTDARRLRRRHDAVQLQPGRGDQRRPAADGLHAVRRLDALLGALRRRADGLCERIGRAADPDWFFFATGGTTPATCATPAACAFIPARTSQSFAWNHGDIQDEIASTWIGMVGPGVDHTSGDDTTWTDHTDLRPTIVSLVGLRDDYTHDGRLLSGDLSGYAIPAAVKKNLTGF